MQKTYEAFKVRKFKTLEQFRNRYTKFYFSIFSLYDSIYYLNLNITFINFQEVFIKKFLLIRI